MSPTGAMVRSASQPPSFCVNPFWSEDVRANAQLEHRRPDQLDEDIRRVQAQRPEEMPVPYDEEWNDQENVKSNQTRGEAVQVPRRVQASPVRGRSSQDVASAEARERSRHQRNVDQGGARRNDVLRLERPASWEAAEEPQPAANHVDKDVEDESLERTVERAMLEQLKRQNELLQQQVDWLMGGSGVRSGTTSWSHVTMSELSTPPPPPPEPVTPERETPMMTPMSPSQVNPDRWTPNGTRVPMGSPPKAPTLPAWPMSLPAYDREDSRMHQAKRDDRAWQPMNQGPGNLRSWCEPRGVQGNGRANAMQDLPGRGAQSRQEFCHEDRASVDCGLHPGHGARSRQEFCHEVRANASPAVLGQDRAGMDSGPHPGHGARSRHEVCHQVRADASSGLHPGHGARPRQEVSHQARADGLYGLLPRDGAQSRHEVCHQDRTGMYHGDAGVQSQRQPQEQEHCHPCFASPVRPPAPPPARQDEPVMPPLMYHQSTLPNQDGAHGQDDEWMRQQRAEEANRLYWNAPVWQPNLMSAHGAAARPIMEATLQDMQKRVYTQQEVDEILREEKRRREKSEGRSKDERTDEGLRSFPVTLPALPEPHISHASLEAGDWLTQVQPLIADVSGAASAWWSKVVEKTTEQYHKWLSATPLDKLKVNPPDHSELARNHERLAQRVGVMLMQTLPTGLRQELVASRKMDAASILFKVFTTYQPGGLAERRQMLSQLTETAPATSPSEAVASLRLWKRQAQRAAELHATMPDAVLQVRALTVIMENLLNKCSQASFRISAYRMNHGIDINPTDSDIAQFYDLLLAEAEHMVSSQSSELRSSTDSTDSGKPYVKAFTPSPSKPKGSPCKYWGTENGRKHGRNCQFSHDWQALQDKGERCWVCSARAHRKAECPTIKPKEEQTPAASGGSGGGSNGEAAAKSHDGKGKGKSKKAKGAGKSGKTDNKGGEESKIDKDNEAPQPSVKAEKVTSAKEELPAVSGGGNGGGQEALMSEVTSLLRSIRVQNSEPQIKMITVKSLHTGQKGHTLLDGGATHCLRTARSEEEWNAAATVNVQLASGEVTMRQHPETSTLLVKDDVQAIVPVAKLVECGYTVLRDRETCRVEHVRHGRVPIEMVQGCPTVSETWGRKLMSEVEEMELKKAKLRAVICCGTLAETDFEKRAAELQALFPQVPLRILERIPGEQHWSSDQVPFNRRRRRQIERAKGIIINMCSGPDVKRWSELEKDGIVVINLDILLGVNVMDPHVSGWLESVIDSGKVLMRTSGPPRRTVSLCRQRGLVDGGPKPLRAREGHQRFGLTGLTANQQELADHDAAVWLKNIWYMRRVKLMNPNAEILLEQPQDPREWAQDGTHCPTFLIWPETQAMIRDLQLREVRVNQGRMGHATTKPTTLVTDIPEVHALEDESRARQPMSSWPEDLQARMQLSKQLAQWAPGLVAVLKIAMRRKVDSGPALKALSQKEREAIASWKAHVDNNHYPYRRDCAVCIETLGKDRPRRRQKAPEPFTLALDVAGPFIAGDDQVDKVKPRYFVVGTMTIPMLGDKPLVEGLRRLAGDGDDPLDLPQPPHGENAELEEGNIPELEGDGSHKAAEDDDPFQELADPQEQEPNPLPEARIKELDAENQKWKDFMVGIEERPAQTFSMAAPTRSKKGHDVVRASAQIVARLRSLQIPINRVHTDRGTEFCGKVFQDWVHRRDFFHTTTAGDEPASNARAENELKIIKGRARTLMRTARCPNTMWPLAVRYASEERFRRQLQSVGVPTPPMLPFGLRAFAKQKAWQNRSAAWRSPMTEVRVWGPAFDMSMTSKGYFLQIMNTGKFMRSTVIIVPKHGPAIADQPPGHPCNLEEQPPMPPDDVASVSYAPSIAESEVVAQRLEDDNGNNQDAVSNSGEPPQPAEAVSNSGEQQQPASAISNMGEQLQPEEAMVLVEDGEIELELGEAPPGDNGIPSHDPPRRRLRGKQPGLPHERQQEPILRKIGGESNGGGGSHGGSGENTGCLTVGAVAQAQRPGDNIYSKILDDFGNQRYEEKLEELKVYEQAGLVQWATEERMIASEDAAFQALRQAEETAERLRDQLEETAKLRKMEAGHPQEEDEVLQTRVVSAEEVRADMEAWKPAFLKEYETLIAGPVKPISDSELRALEADGTKVEILPAKAIASRKPPNKRKGRIVVCGNFAEERDQQDVSVGGVCAMTVRTVVHRAACDDLQLGTIDVSGAFLQAPRRERGTVTIVQPPRLLQQLGIIPSTEKWRVFWALYGMVESPSDWAVYRDGRLKKLTWWHLGIKYKLEKTAEQHPWRVVKEAAEGEESTAGWIAVYVDDFLVAMKEEEISGAFTAIKSTWKCSDEELADRHHSMRFCGYEIQKSTSGGYVVTQEGYIKDILDKYQVSGKESQPLPKIEDEEDEQNPSADVIKQAQTLCGELQWISQRTRVDITYAVGVLARLIHRRPAWVVASAHYLLKYLNGTKEYGLRYEPAEKGDVSWKEITVMADTSFAPPHEKFRSVQGILVLHGNNLLAWESTRQAFITQSTAEAELVGYNEAFQLGEAFWKSLGSVPTESFRVTVKLLWLRCLEIQGRGEQDIFG